MITKKLYNTHIKKTKKYKYIKNIKNIKSNKSKSKSNLNNKKTKHVIKNIARHNHITNKPHHSKHTHKYTRSFAFASKNKNNFTLNQKGGVFGIDYIIFKWNMRNFNKLITKLNKFDSNMQKEITSYQNQLEIFKSKALDKATLLTELLNNYRQKIIFNIYEQYEIINSDTVSTIDNMSIISSNKTLDAHILNIIERAKELDNSIGKDMPEYMRLIKSFDTKRQQYDKLTEDYALESKFLQKIKDMKNDYDTILKNISSSNTNIEKGSNILSKDNKSKLSKAHIGKINRFEEHKSDYLKVLKLDDSELQERKTIQNNIITILTETEYYKNQFGEYKGTKKIQNTGALDTQMYGINCETGGLICEWRDKYNEFAEELLNIIDNCKQCIEKINIIYVSVDKSMHNLASIIIEKDIMKTQEPHALALIRMRDDINDFKLRFDLINKALIEFKAQEKYELCEFIKCRIDIYKKLI